MIEQLGERLGQNYYRQHRDHEQEHVPRNFTRSRAAAARYPRGSFECISPRFRLDEKFPVATSLDRQEDPVEQNGK
jgi:hypothetical protein